MRGIATGWLCICVGALAAAAPQAGAPATRSGEQQAPGVVLSLRVLAVRADGLLVVDRGASDGLAKGDRVFFQPLGGGTLQGEVTGLEERRAGVQLLQRGARIAIGTRGEVRIAATRLAAPAPPPGPQEPAQVPDSDAEWTRPEDGWTPRMPLLAKVDAIRPEKRPQRITGRAYVSGDAGAGPETGRSDIFLRSSADVLVENPFDRGGELHIDAELNYRRTDLPDLNPDEQFTRLRVDRASYSWGGTRFDKLRQEAGRFIQDGVPEFGILDGYEFGQRLENGDRYGASVGFMPEPTPQMQSGHDFQLAGYYQFVSDKREELSATAGFQKTFHDGSADRDLLLGKLRFLPRNGWDFNGTVWADLYTGGDTNKGRPIDLTQARLSTSRSYEGGHSMTVSLVHQSFADIQRFEYEPVAASQIANSRADRLAVSGWRTLESGNRLRGHAGIWNDQDDSGGDLEGGIEVVDFLTEGLRADAALFGTQGAYSVIYGARFALGGDLSRVGWNISYEVSNHTLEGFAPDNDTIWQHRVSGDLELYAHRGWALTLNGSLVDWNGNRGGRLGFYLQRSF